MQKLLYRYDIFYEEIKPSKEIVARVIAKYLTYGEWGVDDDPPLPMRKASVSTTANATVASRRPTTHHAVAAVSCPLKTHSPRVHLKQPQIEQFQTKMSTYLLFSGT